MTCIGASRLQQIATILKAPISFFFEGAPTADPLGRSTASPDLTGMADIAATIQGLRLIRNLMRIRKLALRRHIVQFVQELASDED